VTIVHSAMQTHMNRPNWLDLAFLWLCCLLQFICVRLSFLRLFCALVYLCTYAFVVLDLVSSVSIQEIG